MVITNQWGDIVKFLKLGSKSLLVPDWLVDEYQDLLDCLIVAISLDDNWKLVIEDKLPSTFDIHGHMRGRGVGFGIIFKYDSLMALTEIDPWIVCNKLSTGKSSSNYIPARVTFESFKIFFELYRMDSLWKH